METNIRQVIQAFDELGKAEQHQVLVQLLRRSVSIDFEYPSWRERTFFGYPCPAHHESERFKLRSARACAILAPRSIRLPGHRNSPHH